MIFENVYNRVKVIDFHQDLIIASINSIDTIFKWRYTRNSWRLLHVNCNNSGRGKRGKDSL